MTVDKDPPVPRIKVTENGPYLVSGGLPLAKWTIVVDEDGESASWREDDRFPDKERYSLCRCGRSDGKPYCDGSHHAFQFDGSEAATREPYSERSGAIDGPVLVLTDAVELCAEARFCHRAGGVWNLVKDAEDPDSCSIVRDQAEHCPAGRYVAVDKATGQAQEPELAPSIGLVEDPHEGVSGPIWARGGIPVESSDGYVYEVRNRVTLCRCGSSLNKPFCDGSHIAEGFTDEE